MLLSFQKYCFGGMAGRVILESAFNWCLVKVCWIKTHETLKNTYLCSTDWWWRATAHLYKLKISGLYEKRIHLKKSFVIWRKSGPSNGPKFNSKTPAVSLTACLRELMKICDVRNLPVHNYWTMHNVFILLQQCLHKTVPETKVWIKTMCFQTQARERSEWRTSSWL